MLHIDEETFFSEVAEIAARGMTSDLFLQGVTEPSWAAFHNGANYITAMTHAILDRIGIITPLDITTSIRGGVFVKYVLEELSEAGRMITPTIEAEVYKVVTDAIEFHFSTALGESINIKQLTKNVASYLVDKAMDKLKTLDYYGTNILYSMNYVRQSERVVEDLLMFLRDKKYLTEDGINYLIKMHGKRLSDLIRDYAHELQPQYQDAIRRKMTDIIVNATSSVNEDMEAMKEDIEVYDQIIEQVLSDGVPADIAVRDYVNFVENYNIYKNAELAYRVTYNEYINSVLGFQGKATNLTFFDRASIELKAWSNYALQIGVNAMGQIKYGYNNMVYWFAQYLYSLGSSTTWHAAVKTVMDEAGLGTTLTGAALLGTQGSIWSTFMANVMLMFSPIGGMIIKAASVSVAVGGAALGVLKAGLTFISGALMFHGLFGVFCVGLATGAIAGTVYIGTKMKNYIRAGNLNEAMQTLHARFPVIPAKLIDKYYFINVLVLTFAPEIKPYEHDEKTLGKVPRVQYPENKIISDNEAGEEAKRRLKEKYSGWERVRGAAGDILLADLRKQSQTEFFFPYVNDDAAVNNATLTPLVNAILTHQNCFTPKPAMFMFARIEVVAIEKVS